METMDHETETPPPDLGVGEAALRLRVSVSTVHRYLAAGRLEGYRTVGGHRRITVASVEHLYAETVGRREVGG